MHVKVHYSLKSLIIVFAAVGAVIPVSFLQSFSDEYELVGVQITPVGWVVLGLGLIGFVLGVAFCLHRLIARLGGN
jgi:preprotein translocase subunit Sec61beta